MIWVVATMQSLAILGMVYANYQLHQRVTKLERARLGLGGSSTVATAVDSSYRDRPGEKESRP